MSNIPLWDDPNMLRSHIHQQNRQIDNVTDITYQWQEYCEKLNRQKKQLAQELELKQKSFELANGAVRAMIQERFASANPDNIDTFDANGKHLLFHLMAKFVHQCRTNGWDDAWSIAEARAYNLMVLAAYRNINDLNCAEDVMQGFVKLQFDCCAISDDDATNEKLNLAYNKAMACLVRLGQRSTEIRKNNDLLKLSFESAMRLHQRGIQYETPLSTTPIWQSLLNAGYMDRSSRELNSLIDHMPIEQIAQQARDVANRDLQDILLPSNMVGKAGGWRPQIYSESCMDHVVDIPKDKKESYQNSCRQSRQNWMNGSQDPNPMLVLMNILRPY